MASAATYYVAVNGNDGKSGSRQTPFRTLERAASAARAGDTVIVEDGTYGPGNSETGGDSDPNNHSAVKLMHSGKPDDWITFRAEHKWGATLDCELRCDNYIDLYNSSYIVIQDFVITRGFKEGIHSNDAAHHITIKGNRIENIANRFSSVGVGLDGMYTNRRCHDFIIEGNVFRNIGRTNKVALDHALYLHGTNFAVVNNLFYDIPHGWSIQVADGTENLLIANNTFAFTNADGQSGHIMLWDSQNGVTIRNNIFYRPRNFAVTRYHSKLSSCVLDHNMIYGADGVLEDSKDCRVSDNRVGVDPKFVNPTNAPYDFRLQPNSPAVQAGAPVSAVLTDIDGRFRAPSAAADLGAYAVKTAKQ